MKPGFAPITAFERARIAYAAMQQRQREVMIARRLLERSRAIRMAVLLTASLVLLVGVAIYNGWLPELMGRPFDPARAEQRRFGETRTAQVRSFHTGNTCRELLFSNDQGRYVSGSIVDCEADQQRTMKSVPSSLNSIRKAFSNR